MKFKNIVLHWTAGSYYPCAVDIEHYHYVIDINGKVYTGKYTAHDNLDCTDGKYAAHCGGGNTGRIGIAICCRRNVYMPPVRKQVEALCNLAAQLCITYELQPKDCITHAEFGLLNPTTSSRGKIDINELPYVNITGIKTTANYLRNKIQWYYNKWKKT